MDSERAAVVEALRSAAAALRLAELVLSREPVAPKAEEAMAPLPVPEVIKPSPAPLRGGPGKHLLQYLLDEAHKRTAFEEQDAESFAAWLAEPGLPDLLSYVADKQTYQVAPGGPAAAVNHDLVPALTTLGKLLKVMSETELRPAELIGPFLAKLQLKHWSESDPARDFTAVKYATPGKVEHQVDLDELRSHIEAAKQAVPGSVEQVAVALRADGIDWEPFVDGEPNPVLILRNVHAKWLATFDLMALAEVVAERLAVVRANVSAANIGWWDAARASAQVPPALLHLVRARVPQVTVARARLQNVLSWARSLPGWPEQRAGADQNARPLFLRKATAQDILG